MKTPGNLSIGVRLLLCLFISSIASVIAVLIVDTSAPAWYLHSSGESSLNALSEDYGFAMFLVFWYAIGTLSAFSLSFYLSWKFLSKKSDGSKK